MPRLTQRAFNGGEISESLHDRVDFETFRTALATCYNAFVHVEGGVSNRPGTIFIGETKDSSRVSRLIEFQFNTEQAYALEFGHQYMRPIKDDGQILETGVSISSISKADPGVVTANSHGFSDGDHVFIDDGGDMVEINSRVFQVAGATTHTFELNDLEGNTIDTSGYTTYSAGGTVSRLYTLTTTYQDTDVFNLNVTQSADKLTIVEGGFNPREITRTGHAAWTIGDINFSPTQADPGGLAVAAVGTVSGLANRTYEYVVTAVNSDGEESLGATAVNHTINAMSDTYGSKLTWTAPSGTIDHYRIYRAISESAKVYGLVGTADGSVLAFEDYNNTPNMDLGPPSANLPFDGSDNKPRCVTHYSQRLVFGATNNLPQTVFMTEAGNLTSLRSHQPLIPSDGIQFTIAAKQVNRITNFIALDSLLILTTGAEWLVTEGSEGVVSAPTIGFKPQSYNGSNTIEPLVIGDAALYVQEKGSRVRDIGYVVSAETTASKKVYKGNDVSILARHLFKKAGVTYRIVDWAYQKEPYNIIWAIRNDGVLLSFTYNRDSNIWGWARHATDGYFESVCSVSESTSDAIYFIIKRNINGVDKRFIEKLHDREMIDVTDAFFVDCGLTYNGSYSSTIGNLHHLEGKDVAVLADGNVVYGKTVINGEITLDVAASKVHVGLPYVSDVGGLDIDDQERTVKGVRKNIAELTMSFLDSRGGFVGPDENNLKEIKFRKTSDAYDAIALKTEDITVSLSPKWSEGGRFLYRQTDPLPFTILSVTPHFDIA